jgi:ABC-2 type transport system permease protein
VGTLSATASVALGLLLATVVKNERQAGSIAPLIVVPLSFLTEAFFPLSLTVVAEGTPWGQAVRAMRGMLTFGVPFEDIYPMIGWMAVQTVVLFAVAVFIFRRTRLVAQ